MLTFYSKKSEQPAHACMIWLHGLGSSGANMHAVVDAFPVMDLVLEHVFVDAPVRPVTMNQHMPMRAWYDLTGLTLQDRDDTKGILESEQDIQKIIDAQIAQGYKPEQIYLAGFSQGGAMALFIGLRTRQKLGGVVSLSSYLPRQPDCLVNNHLSLPIFMAMGTEDPIVLPVWTKLSYEFILNRGFTEVTWKEYQMEHTICMEEVKDILSWMENKISQTTIPGETL